MFNKSDSDNLWTSLMPKDEITFNPSRKLNIEGVETVFLLCHLWCIKQMCVLL